MYMCASKFLGCSSTCCTHASNATVLYKYLDVSRFSTFAKLSKFILENEIFEEIYVKFPNVINTTWNTFFNISIVLHWLVYFKICAAKATLHLIDGRVALQNSRCVFSILLLAFYNKPVTKVCIKLFWLYIHGTRKQFICRNPRPNIYCKWRKQNRIFEH